MTLDVSRYMDPDEMVESDVMGVTEDSTGFIRASQLLQCEWCGNTAVHPAEVAAVKPLNHTVMMCNKCMPNPPEEWI